MAFGSAIGCRRDDAPEPVPESDDLPVALTFVKGLQALTNLTAFSETPRGHPSRITHDGPFHDLVATNGWIELAALRGPGCIHRIWSNADSTLQWRFYFDHEPAPRLELDSDALFGGRSPFLAPLADTVNGGRISYVPLPFEQSMRIVIGGADPAILSHTAAQIDYRIYEGEPVAVTSYRDPLNEEEHAIVDRVRQAWQHAAGGLRAAAEACGPSHSVMLPPGETVVWMDEQGPGILKAFRLHIAFPDELSVLDRARMQRALVLRFYWDDAGFPSVDVPLGDFFINAMRPRRFASLPLGTIDGYYVCRFPMPFQQAARAELRNEGRAPVILRTAAHIKRGVIPPRQRNVFHAGWQTATDPTDPFYMLRREPRDGAGLPADAIQGVPAADRDRRGGASGHLVGMMLHVLGLSRDAWPIFEAVDRVAIHGPEETLLRGTGLSAAFNADGRLPGIVDHPMAGLVETAPIRAQGYRWYLTDRVPFTNGIDYYWTFEHAPPVPRSLAATAYWYQPRPRPVPRLPSAGERQPPADPLAQETIMCALFELERLGHDDEARDQAIEYYEHYPNLILADYLRVRALAYEERLSGYPVVEELYKTLRKRLRGTAVGRELDRLQWFHRGTDHGLFATQINGRFRAYLNGERIEQGDNPTTLVVRPVRLRPGTNLITVKVIPNKPDAWMSLHLRTHHTQVVSGPDWEFTRQKPSDWPAADCEDTPWKPVAETLRFPLPRWWRLTPNIFPHMQSADQLVIPWRGPGWTEPPYQETYFRKRFEMPETMETTEIPLPELEIPPHETLENLN